MPLRGVVAQAKMNGVHHFEPLTYDIRQAAERIGPLVTVDYLKKHLAELPHCKSGKGTGRAGRVAFTEAHLAEIVLLLEKRPTEIPAPSGPESFSGLVTGRRRVAHS